MNEQMRKSGLRLVVLICNVTEGRKADELMQNAHLPVRYRFRAEGTAGDEVLDYLGLADTEKVVLLCAVPKALAPTLGEALRRELYLEKPGNGILFSVPISGASNPMFKLLDEETRKSIQTTIESEVQKMGESAKYSLVLAAVNQGYSEKVMEIAKDAGVKGGTVIRARRLGLEDAMQFWGISVQSEKDLVAILVPKEQKLALMRAIGEQCNQQSEAQGVVLSLPVDEVVGVE